jgi:hypothetical protein
VYEAGAEYLENHRHELVGAALRNEVGGERSSPRASEVSV